jgi:hypothetical protein
MPVIMLLNHQVMRQFNKDKFDLGDTGSTVTRQYECNHKQ